MTRADDLLDEILSPVRDLFLARVLEEIAFASDRDYDCEADVIRHDAHGQLERTGPLNLPMRRDIQASRNGQQFRFDVNDTLGVTFDPFSYLHARLGEVRVAPFQWNTLCVDFQSEDISILPNWDPLRRWYLEAFQIRFSDDSEEFRCTVHSLRGPERHDGAWRIILDLGSMPVADMHGLLDALAMLGARQVHLRSPLPKIPAASGIAPNS